jgi:hypothetical protein
MPKFVSSELPEDLYTRLCGRFVDRYLDQVILLYTVDKNGWPHPALLSYFEVAARDRKNLRLATYKDSTTTANMRSSGRVTLSIFAERAAYSLKGTAEEIRREMKSINRNTMLNVAIEQVLVDEADPVLEPGAYIAAGVVCVNPNLGTERTWRNKVLTELMESQ